MVQCDSFFGLDRYCISDAHVLVVLGVIFPLLHKGRKPSTINLTEMIFCSFYQVNEAKLTSSLRNFSSGAFNQRSFQKQTKIFNICTSLINVAVAVYQNFTLHFLQEFIRENTHLFQISRLVRRTQRC